MGITIRTSTWLALLGLAVAAFGQNKHTFRPHLSSLTPNLDLFVQQGGKLVGTGVAGIAAQGWSVALSADGSTALVGGSSDNANAGAVWVFTRTAGVWTQQGGKLVGSDAAGLAYQGYSVALSADGNTALIGGPVDNNNVGAAWVFTRSAGVWTQQGSKLVGSGAVGTANQGFSVALSADGLTALIGGPIDNSSTGAAWLFTSSGGVWTQQGGKLVGSGAVGNAQQGLSVALSADGATALIGGPCDGGSCFPVPVNPLGAVWVFTNSGGVWTQQGGKLVGSGAVGNAEEGYSVALSGDGSTALIGGPVNNSSTGAAWVFTASGGVWTQQGGKLVGAGAVGSASQGFSVTLSGDGTTAVVGGPNDNNDTGAAWVFTSSAGVWTQLGGKLVGAGAVGNALQGFSVALSSDATTAIVGGPHDNSLIGAAWVYVAAPVTPLLFVPVTPCRVVDTRNPNGPFGGPKLFGNSRDFPIPDGACGIPSTALAYSFNVTAVPSGPLGYLTIWPTGQPQPVVSTLNSQHGINKADAAIVPAGTNGSVSVYGSAATDVVLDINGYFVADSGLAFYPLTPCRVVDTRNANGPLGGPIMQAAQTRTFPLQTGTCNIPDSAQAYALNFTVVPSGPLGYLTTWPTGEAQPVVSTLNAPTGLVTANAAIVPAGSSGDIDVYTSAKTHVVIDINGYFAPVGMGGLSFYAVTPCRAVDTRNAPGPLGGPTLYGERDFPLSTSACGLPLSAQAFSLNATVVPVATLGYLTLWPQGAPQPVVSTLNSPDGSIDSNAAIVPTTNGSISAYASSGTQLILDTNGYFAP